MNFKNTLSIAFLIISLSSCVESLHVPNENDAALYNTSLDTLKMGRGLYINKCSSCHNLFLPASHSKNDWLIILDKMQAHALIDGSQKELIYKYLKTSAKTDSILQSM